MEPNTSSAAAATSPATADGQAPSSVQVQTLLPPPSLLVSASSPAMGDDASLSVHGHAASPSLPPATHLPTLLAGGQPSSSASPGLPAFLSEGIPGFAAKLVLLEQLAAWQRETPLVSPPSGSDLPPQSSDSSGGDGCGQTQSPDYELPPLPESLRIPELEEASTHSMSSTIGMIMPSNCGGSSMGIKINSSSSSSRTTLSVGAKKPSRFLHLPPWADGSSNSTEVNFNKYEREIISKDRSLQDLVNTDLKKVKRLIAYRVCSAKRKAVEDRHALELQRQVEVLQTMRDTKSAELQLVQAQRAELQAEQMEMSMMVHELDRQVMLKDAMSETLQAQINALNLIIFNAVQMNSKNIDETNVSGADDLHQQSSTQTTYASGSHTWMLYTNR